MMTIYYDPRTKTMHFPIAEAVQNVYAEMLQELAELDEGQKQKDNVTLA